MTQLQSRPAAVPALKPQPRPAPQLAQSGQSRHTQSAPLDDFGTEPDVLVEAEPPIPSSVPSARLAKRRPQRERERFPWWGYFIWLAVGLTIAGIIFAVLGRKGEYYNPLAPVTPVSGALAALPTPTARPIVTVLALPPTPAPVTIPTTEWGLILSANSPVRAAPSDDAPLVERLNPNTLIAWQNKLPDGSWYERSGGGWIAHQNTNVYPGEEAARSAQK